jgi:hypothetical protein
MLPCAFQPSGFEQGHCGTDECDCHQWDHDEPDHLRSSSCGSITLTTQEAGMSTRPSTTTFKWSGAELPKGMKLSSAGVLSGTPSKKLVPGAYCVVAHVTETR